MTEAETLEAIAYYQAIFDKPVPDEYRAIWRAKFADLEYAAVIAAIDRLGGARNFPPNVLQVRAGALETHRENAYAAWTHVLACADKHGRHNRPMFENAATARSVAAIGWVAICDSNINESWMLDRFARIYDAFAKDDRPEQHHALPGRTQGIPELVGAIDELAAGIVRGEDA